MGWDYLERESGVSDQDFFQRELFGGTAYGQTILACNTGPGLDPGETVFYAAVFDHGTERVWGMVCLQDRSYRADSSRNSTRFNYGYKMMDEGMGPCYYGASAEVLDLLTPLTDEDGQYAGKWRENCRAGTANGG